MSPLTCNSVFGGSLDLADLCTSIWLPHSSSLFWMVGLVFPRTNCLVEGSRTGGRSGLPG